MRSVAGSETPSPTQMKSLRQSVPADLSRSFYIQNRNIVERAPDGLNSSYLVGKRNLLSIMKDKDMQKSVTRSQNRRVLFNQVSRIGDIMLKSQGTIKSVLEKRGMGSMSPKKKNEDDFEKTKFPQKQSLANMSNNESRSHRGSNELGLELGASREKSAMKFPTSDGSNENNKEESMLPRLD
jgi:hypothetical protein